MAIDLWAPAPARWAAWPGRVLLAASRLLRKVEGFGQALRLWVLSARSATGQAVAEDQDKYADVKIQTGRLRGGDPDAWDALVSEWTPRLLAYLRRHVPTKEDAQDLLSETFVAAVKAIHVFDGNANMSTWLYALAHHKLVDFWRRTKFENELAETLTVAEDDDTLDFNEAFKRLPAPARQVLQLRYVEGFGVDEIAKILGRTYKATESLLSRSRAMLKQVLGEAGITAADLE